MSLTNPTIMINGNVQKYLPNTFEYKDGFGTRNVITQTTGNGNIEHEFTEDVTTQRGYVKFSVVSSAENIKRYNQFMRNMDGNVIELSFPRFNRQFERMIIMEEQAKPGGMDAQFDMIFEGSAAL